MALRQAFPSPGRLPPGVRIYAVGDVHGCLAQLVALHAQIAADLAERPMAETRLVHLGDYVDRGPDSAGVVARLRRGDVPPVARRADLLGNHEALMLGAQRGDPEALALWLGNGGTATLASYGIPAADQANPRRWSAIPEADIAWLQTLQVTHRAGSYLFVHAGIRPGRSLASQAESDLLWIREPFLSDPTPRELVVVHGHTPSAEPEIRPNRIGIDTGAALGGRLTCAVLEADTVGFLTA